MACLSGHVGVVGLLLSRFFLGLKRQDHIYSNNLDWYSSVKATLSKYSLPMGQFAGRRSCWRTRTRKAERRCTLPPPTATMKCAWFSLDRSKRVFYTIFKDLSIYGVSRNIICILIDIRDIMWKVGCSNNTFFLVLLMDLFKRKEKMKKRQLNEFIQDNIRFPFTSDISNYISCNCTGLNRKWYCSQKLSFI